LIDQIKAQLQTAADVVERMRSSHTVVDTIQSIAESCVGALRGGGKVLLGGNGGSAADAQHLAGEFVSRLAFDRPGLPALALTVDTSVMTAVANDYGYERLFARQIQALGRKGDVFIAISTSGRSPNVLQGLEEARRMELVCVGFTGASGGRMPAACDICLHVPAQETPRIQEGHIIAGHIVCGLVEAALFERPKT